MLGFAFNFGIIMAYSATTQHVPISAWYWYIIACIWTIAYDTQYAISDREFDLKLNVKSTAVLLGAYTQLFIVLLQAMVIIMLVAWGVIQNYHWPYYAINCINIALFLYQYRLITPPRQLNTDAGDMSQYAIKAFNHNHWVGLVIWLSILSQLSLIQ